MLMFISFLRPEILPSHVMYMYIHTWICNSVHVHIYAPKPCPHPFRSLFHTHSHVLTCSYDTKIEHYRVIKKKNLVTVDDEEFFENLFKLVEVSKHVYTIYSVCRLSLYICTCTCIMYMNHRRKRCQGDLNIHV